MELFVITIFNIAQGLRLGIFLTIGFFSLSGSMYLIISADNLWTIANIREKCEFCGDKEGGRSRWPTLTKLKTLSVRGLFRGGTVPVELYVIIYPNKPNFAAFTDFCILALTPDFVNELNKAFTNSFFLSRQKLNYRVVRSESPLVKKRFPSVDFTIF